MEFNVTLKANDGRMVTMAAQQANAIQVMNNTRKAGISSVVGYKPTTSWKVAPTQDIQLITHISVENLYKRRLAALNEITFKDVLVLCADNPVLAGETPDKAGETHGVKSLKVLFDTRMAGEVASLEKSLAAFAGEVIETDNHREAHKLCYAHFGSVKINLVTEGKPKEPVLDTDGNVQLASIMVPYIELNVTTKVEGVRKPEANSGASVLMQNQIKRAMNKRSVNLKTLSLKADNFEAFKVDGKQILAEDVARLGDIIAA
jgi:hypothetical protein